MLTQTANGDIYNERFVVMRRGNVNSQLGNLQFNLLDENGDWRFAYSLQMTESGCLITVYDLTKLQQPGGSKPPPEIGQIAITGQMIKFLSNGVYNEWDGLISSVRPLSQ